MSSSYEMPRPDREKEEQVLDLLEGSDPVERKDLEDALDFDEETTQSVIREMLYSGQLATTPDWKYEKREK